MVLDKIKALPDKVLFIIGLTLQLIAILFVIVVVIFNQVTMDRWIDFIFYALYFIGLPFIILLSSLHTIKDVKINKMATV